MVQLGLYLVNSKGQKAFPGDKIKLTFIKSNGWLVDNVPYIITEIRYDGYVIFAGGVHQRIIDIKDFVKCRN